MNWRALTLLSVGVPLVLSGCDDKKDEAPPKIRPVISVIVAPQPASSLQLAGIVQARIQAELGFRVLGRITRRDVSVGDLVTKGQEVAAIDPLALELAVRSGKADLSNAQAQLANASTVETRQRTLSATNSVSEAAYEAAQQARDSAAATVAKAEANLAKAVEQLGYAQLKAEFDGVVTATSVEVGQVVSAGQTAITVARPDLRDVVVDVPEDGMDGLAVGSPFEAQLQLDPSIHTQGNVREIAPEADATTRTRRMKITLNNPPDAFRLGSIVAAKATTDASPTIALPGTALLREGDTISVWLVDPNTKTVSKRPVTISGDGNAARVVIASGLTAGERVAVAGANRLKDGQKVRVDQENAL